MLLRAKIVAIALLLIPYAAAIAQSVSDLIKSPPAPETMDARTLPEDFRAVTLKVSGGTGGMGGWFDVFGPALMFSGGNGPDGPMAQMVDLASVVWTNGQVVRASTGTFLVAYAWAADAGSLSGKKPGDPKLRLQLIREDSIIQITPRPDFTREKLAAIFSEKAHAQQTTNQAKTVSLSNVKQLALGMIMYASDYDDVFPYAQDTKSAFAVIFPYVKNAGIFKSLNPNGGRFLANMAVMGVNGTDILQPAETVLLYDPTPWPDGEVLVAYCDGHAKFVTPETWSQVSKTLRLKLEHQGKPLPPGYWKKINPNVDFGGP